MINLVNEVEQRFPVNSWQVGGLAIWPLVRIRLYFGLFESAYCVGASDSTRPRGAVAATLGRKAGSIVRGQLRRRWATFRDRRMADRIRPADVLFVSDGVSFVDTSGGWVERFCDPLAEYLRTNGLTTLQMTPLHNYLVPRASPSVFIQGAIDLQNILSVAGTPLGRAAGRLDGFERFTAEMERVGVPSSAISARRLLADVRRFRRLERFYERLLAKVRPRLVAVVGYYSLEGMALMKAARSAGSLTVDLQHGVQGELHVAYGRWTACPESGYELLPDIFWCWTDLEASAIHAWAATTAGRHRALVGGNPWLIAWRDGTSADIQQLDSEFKAIADRRDSRGNILVTLQFGLLDREFLDNLIDLIGRLDDGWQWWIRLHPSMLARLEEIHRRFDDAGQDNVEIRFSTRSPLYGLLRHMDAHLTHSSSTVLEAAEFGIASIVTSRYGIELFSAQQRAGIASYGRLDDPRFGRLLESVVALKRPGERSERDGFYAAAHELTAMARGNDR